MNSYELIFSVKTKEKIRSYIDQLYSTPGIAGKRLKTVLAATNSDLDRDIENFTRLLLQTKQPQIFAESDVAGDGSDWNLTELSILGDISAALPVCVFDNGAHANPVVHAEPFQGYLLFVPGALLRSSGKTPCDFAEVTKHGNLDEISFHQLYERRLLPVLLHANSLCEKEGKKGFITVPGIGCGQFSGEFHGLLGDKLNNTLKRILAEHHNRLDCIEALYYDPYKECSNERVSFGGITYFVRPLVQGNSSKSQLCEPSHLQDSGDNFGSCMLLSVVAWDHVSWPGNDFFIGARMTDDGVKAAATDAMYKLTGIEGSYCKKTNRYIPPEKYHNWEDVVTQHRLVFGQSAAILTF